MNNYNILIIDDQRDIVELMEIYLKNEGYNVFKAFNGTDGLNLIEKHDIHLVLLDIMMPEIDGLEVCRKIRETLSISIIMISAKTQDKDKILGLSIGADDYMIKPFNPMELIARVKSQLRRSFYFNQALNNKKDKNYLELRGLAIDMNSHVVSIYGKRINLTPTEYEILLLLAKNPGKVFSAEEIFEAVWREKYFESNNTVMVHMWRLREKIGEDPKKPEFIETVWGVGYKIEK